MSDNLARNVGDHRGCYEVWYVTWNDPRSGDGYWLRYVTEAPSADPARGELWFARFDQRRPERTFGIHGAFPAAVAYGEPGTPFGLSLGGAELGDDRARGELAGNGHRVRWDLRWAPAPATLRLLPDVMYARGGLGETTVLSPNPRVALSGTLEIDGETVAFAGATAGQTHLWGRKHAFAWAWAHCAELAGGDGALLELLAVRLQRGGVTLPALTLVALDLDGEHHRLNQFRHTLGNRASWRTGRIEFRAWSPNVRVAGALTCAPDRLLVAPYIDPDGTEVYCANTEIGDATIHVWRRAGLRWRAHATLTTTGRAHFETGGRDRPAEVARDHVRV